MPVPYIIFHMTKHLMNILLAIFSGVLGFLAFPPFEYHFLAWFAFVPLFIAVRSCGIREACGYSYLAGIVFFAGLLSWLVNVSVPGALILMAYMAVFYALFGAAANIIFRHEKDIMAVPCVWVMIEYIRGHLFTGFPWGLLAYSQYKETGIIQIADVTGAYGVSFLIVVFNTAIFAFVIKMHKKVHYLMLAGVLLVISYMYGINRLNDSMVWGSPRVSVVQGNIPQQDKWDPSFSEDIIKTYSDLNAKAAADKPDMIIWPESSYPYLFEEKGQAEDDLKAIVGIGGVPVLAGIVNSENGKTYNSAFLFDSKGVVAGKYAKMHLVPFGEFIPFEDLFPSFRDHIDKPIGNFARGAKAVTLPMRASRTTLDLNGVVNRQTVFYKFGVLICFEDVFPYISREFVHDGADLLVNMTNDAWFGDTGALRQHMQASVFRAIENKVPVIRAANTGISCFISPTGEVLSRVEENGKDMSVRGVLTYNVNVYRGKTFYTKHGDIFALFTVAMLILLLVSEFIPTKKRA